MQVTDDHLHGVERALKDGWNWRKLERLAGPVVEVFERARPGGRQPELVEFFDGLVRRVVSESGGNPCVALGAILWNETNVRPMIAAPHPLLKPETLGQLIGDPKWPALAQDWYRRYGFPTPEQRQAIGYGRTRAYECLTLGKTRLVELLNEAAPARERARLDDAGSWAKVSQAVAHWLAHPLELSPRTLASIYVPPWLMQPAPQPRGQHFVSESALIEWAEQGRLVVITGVAGSGKSTLLRHLGLLLLQRDELAIWLEPTDLPGSVADLVVALAGKTGISQTIIHTAVQEAIRTQRLVLLADAGEAWPRESVQRLLTLRARLDAGLIVAARERRAWAATTHEPIEMLWSRSQLRQVMARFGHTDLWPALAELLAHDRLPHRPWEFALAAQSALTEAGSPIGFLVAAFQAQLDAHRVPPKTLNLWQAEAWHAVIQRRRHWQPLHPTDQSRANLAVEARLMVKDGERYRFAHDLWRDFLAARYAARQPSAQEVVDDLIGLTDWPQILAWAIQSAWEDGHSAWAIEALQALFNALTQTWHQTACLQGAHVLKSVPNALKQHATTQQIRQYIERVLIDETLTDWQHDPEFATREIVGEVLAEALLAIAPLSPGAVEILWRTVYRQSSPSFKNALETALLREPGVARRILADPLDLPQTMLYDYVAQLGRAPGIQPEELIAHVQRFFPPGADRFSAIVAGLVAQGTPAASALVSYLAGLQGAEIEDAFRLENFLKKWSGEASDLWRHAPRLLANDVAPQVAHHFLINLLPISDLTDDERQPDEVRAFLDHVPAGLSEDQRRAIEAVRSERDFRLIQRRVVEAESSEPEPSVEDIPQLIAALFDEGQIINVSALHQFSADQIDPVLRTRTLRESQRFELARLGTPYAIQQLLNWIHDDPDLIMGRNLSYPSARYREAIWPLLAAAAEAETDEIRRYHLFSAVDILWLEQPAWPWKLVEFFFAHLANQDHVVADKYRDTLLQKATGHQLSAAWSGLAEPEQAAYAAGLTQYALGNDWLERVIALRFLANMPTDLAGHVLTADTLTRLLADSDERILAAALDYVAAHERRDVLAKVRLLARDVQLKKLPPEVQQGVVRTLGQIGEGTDAKRMVQIAREPGNHWAAVAQLIEQRRYWPALHKAIERGEAEANWLTTVAIRQGLIFVVEGRGGLSIRAGANRDKLSNTNSSGQL